MKEKKEGRKPEGGKSGKKILQFEPEKDSEEVFDLEEEEAPETDGDRKKRLDRNRNLRLVKALELDEEDAWEDDEDESGGSPWVTALTFLGLAVLAAIICAILWFFTHPKEEEGQNSSAGITATAEPGAEVSGGLSEGEEGNLPSEQESAGEGAAEPGQNGEAEGNPVSGDNPDNGVMVPSEQIPETDGEGQTGPNQTEKEKTSPEQEADSPGDEFGIEITEGEIQAPVEGTSSMQFTEQKESVTPKDVVNLRSVPSTADDGSIVVQCTNGEVLTRIGINQATGWSRIDYDGETLYAVSQYLTTNLDYKPAVQASNPNRVSTANGRIIIFSNCDDWISPKEYVNLRTEPSTDGGNDTVSCQLNYGEKAHRTGYSADSGWSRVEYDGKVLYVVTSLMYVVEPDGN